MSHFEYMKFCQNHWSLMRILIFVWCGCRYGCGTRLPKWCRPGCRSGFTALQILLFDVDQALFMFRLVKRRKRRRVWYSKLRLCEGFKRISMIRNHTARWVTGLLFFVKFSVEIPNGRNTVGNTAESMSRYFKEAWFLGFVCWILKYFL